MKILRFVDVFLNRKYRPFLLMFFTLFLFSANSSKADVLPDSIANKTITLNHNKVSLKQVLDDISQQTGLVFSYKSDIIIGSEKFSYKNRTLTFGSFLEQNFGIKNISYSFIPPNYIILNKKESYLNRSFIISGFISDSLNGELLVGGNLYVESEKTGTITNFEGFYSIQSLKDTVTIRVSYIGYKTKSIRLHLTSNLRLDIKLSPSVNLPLIIVKESDEKNSVIQESGNKITLKGNQVTETSPLFGESDVFRTLQLLPGVQSVGEGTSGLNIRGGSPDQNLVLLDGIQIYNPIHIFGFYSVFNPGIVKNVALSKGAFSAKYSGRLSSVIDVTTKDGSNHKVKGEAMLGILGSRLTLEGPINKSLKTTFIASARRSHIDLMFSPFIKKNISTNNADFLSNYYFYDINGKVVHHFNKSSKLTLSYYNGKDKVLLNNSFKLESPQRKIKEKDKQSFAWGNSIVAAKWGMILSSKSILKVNMWYSQYNFGNQSNYTFTETNQDSTLENFFDYRFESLIRDLGSSADIEYYLSNKWKISFGAQYIYHSFQPGVTTLTSNLPNLEPSISISEDRTGVEPSIYFDNQIKLLKNTELNLGLNISNFIVLGTFYPSIQPRINVVTRLAKKIVLNAGYSQMQQYMHLLTNSTVGIPNDLWVLSSENLKPQSNKQINIGAKYEGKIINFGVDAFSKNMKNVIDYKDGANYLRTSENWENIITKGIGNSVGIEFYLEKSVGKLTGWLGYCLSKSTRQFDDINDGEVFLYRYHRLHDFSSTVTYNINTRNSLSVNFIFSSGSPITLPIQIYSGISTASPSIDIFMIGKRNDAFMPNYHRMDINYNNYKKNKFGMRIWSFGFYNIYNRQNPFFITPAYNNLGNRVLRQVTLFPIIPSITYKQEF